MIIEQTFYAVQCDNCKVIAEDDDDTAFWSDRGYCIDNAEESDWYIDGEKHYCPDCYSFDDDDNLVVMSSQAKARQK